MRRSPITAAALVRGFTAAATLLAATLCRAQDRDPYEEACARAAALERSGALAAAAGALESLRARYPQDVDLALRIGALRLRAGDGVAAARAYAAAIGAAGELREALLGLGWAEERRGRCAEASAAYRRALAPGAFGPAEPAGSEARAGLRRCTPPTLRATAAAAVAGQALTGGTTSYGLSVAPAVDLLVKGRLQLGASYRFRALSSSLATVAATRQHEAYAHVGYGGRLLGVTAHYAFLYDASAAAPSHHGGLTARVSPFGDGLLQLGASLYRDLAMVRVQPSWRLPVAWGLSIQPGGAYQLTAAPGVAPRHRYSVFLALSLQRGPLSLWAGGRYGDELRPLDLDLGLISNYQQPQVGAAWLGASLDVGPRRRTHLQLGWGVDLLLPDGGSLLTQAHTVSLGAGQSF